MKFEELKADDIVLGENGDRFGYIANYDFYDDGKRIPCFVCEIDNTVMPASEIWWSEYDRADEHTVQRRKRNA